MSTDPGSTTPRPKTGRDPATVGRRRFQVCLVGDSAAGPDALVLAEELGRRIARRGWVLVCGGRTGVMEAACRGADAEGGLAVGILPGEDLDAGNPYCHIVVPTGMGWARNVPNVLAGDVVVALGGRSGTLTELGYAWAFEKPIIAMKPTGGWAGRLAGERIDDRREDHILEAADAAEAEGLMAELAARTCGRERQSKARV